MRLSITLLFMCIVDTWLVYKDYMGPRSTMNQALVNEKLSEELTDNSFDLLGARSANISDISDEHANLLVSEFGFYLIPTSRKRKKCDGMTTQAVYQGRCRVCKSTKKSKLVCSGCRDVFREKMYIRHAGTDCSRFHSHFCNVHDVSAF